MTEHVIYKRGTPKTEIYPFYGLLYFVSKSPILLMFPYLDNIWPISLDLRGRAFSKNRVCDTTTTGLNNAILIYNKTISHVYVDFN